MLLQKMWFKRLNCCIFFPEVNSTLMEFSLGNHFLRLIEVCLFYFTALFCPTFCSLIPFFPYLFPPFSCPKRHSLLTLEFTLGIPPFFSRRKEAKGRQEGELKGFWLLLKHIGDALFASWEYGEKAIGDGIKYKSVCSVYSFRFFYQLHDYKPLIPFFAHISKIPYRNREQ